MDVKEIFGEVERAIETLNSVQTRLKPRFEAVIRDKSIPLEERLELWLKAPDLLKEHKSSYVRWSNLHGDAIITEGAILDVDRHETVHLSTIIECLNEKWWDYVELAGLEAQGDVCQWTKRRLKLLFEVFEDFDFNAFYEEVLERNIGSYEYDW